MPQECVNIHQHLLYNLWKNLCYVKILKILYKSKPLVKGQRQQKRLIGYYTLSLEQVEITSLLIHNTFDNHQYGPHLYIIALVCTICTV